MSPVFWSNLCVFIYCVPSDMLFVVPLSPQQLEEKLQEQADYEEIKKELR